MDKPQIDVRDKGFKNLPSLAKALENVYKRVSLFDTEIVDLRQYTYYQVKILAEDVKAIYSVPNFTRATMDGFAIISDDTTETTTSNPLYLTVIEELTIKEASKHTLNHNQAIKIPTGGVLPSGADCVIKIEDVIVEKTHDDYKLKITRWIESGKNISEKGEDYQKDDIILKKGRLLTPVDVGVLISAGISRIKCFKSPKIGVISTGDELVDEDRELTAGEVYESNSFVLIQYLSQLGFAVKRYQMIRDDYTSIKERMEEIMNENDFIISTGGTSTGNKDFIPLILNELSNVIVHGVSIRPGSPTTFGMRNNKYFLGLPGFPVSSLLSFSFFGLPIILHMMGSVNVSFLKVKAFLAESFSSVKGKTEFLRVSLDYTDGKIVAKPIRVTGSSLLHTLSQSDGIVIFDDETEKISKNEIVNVVIIDKLVNY